MLVHQEKLKEPYMMTHHQNHHLIQMLNKLFKLKKLVVLNSLKKKKEQLVVHKLFRIMNKHNFR